MIDDDLAPGTWDMVKMMDTLDISLHEGGVAVINDQSLLI
jgi:hypothetical protein